jgi:hypothetical protein
MAHSIKVNKPIIISSNKPFKVKVGHQLLIGGNIFKVEDISGGVYKIKSGETTAELSVAPRSSNIILTIGGIPLNPNGTIKLIRNGYGPVDVVVRDGALTGTKCVETMNESPIAVEINHGDLVRCDVYRAGELFDKDVDSAVGTIASTETGMFAIVRNCYGTFLTSDMENFVSVNGMGLVLKAIVN